MGRIIILVDEFADNAQRDDLHRALDKAGVVNIEREDHMDIIRGEFGGYPNELRALDHIQDLAGEKTLSIR